MIGAVLFDCDGVLADSEPLNHRCWSEVFEVQLGARLPADPSCIVGLDLERIFALGCAAAGRSLESVDRDTRQALLAHKSRLFLEHAPASLGPVRGARELVAAVRSRGIPRAVVSSALRARLLRTLELVGLAEAFAVVLSGEDAVAGRKDWARAAHACGARPAESIALDDSAEGVASARDAGIGWVIGVATALSPARLQAAGAHRVVPGPWAVDLDAIFVEAPCASP